MTAVAGSKLFHRLVSSAASDNATIAFDRPSSMRHMIGFNNRGSAVFLKIYSLQSPITAPTSAMTPVMTIYLPATSAFALDFGDGVGFNFGLGYRMTTGSADNDVAAIAAGDILGLNILGAVL